MLAIWEGGRSIIGCCASRVTSKETPRIRAVSKVKKGKSVEERVQEAIQKELSEGLRERLSSAARARSLMQASPKSSTAMGSSIPPPVEPVPPPPVGTYHGRRSSSSQTESARNPHVQCQGTQTEVLYPAPFPAQVTGVAIHQVMTTRRGGAHLR